MTPTLIRHVMVRVVRAVRDVLLLQHTHAPSRAWARVHWLVLTLLVLLFGIGVVLPRVAPFNRAGQSMRALAPLLLSAALAGYVLERLLGLVYGRPVTRSALAKSFVARHPLAVAFLAALLALGPVVSPEALLALESPVLLIRVLARMALCLCTLPAWYLLLHPVAIARASRQLRGARRSVCSSVRALPKRLLDHLRASAAPLRVVLVAVRARYRSRQDGSVSPGADNVLGRVRD